jgi:peptide/nickel transport system substrate-binding protein
MALTLFACGKKETTSSPDANPSTAAPDSVAPDSVAPDSVAPSGPPVSARDSITLVITQDRGTLDPLYTVGWDYQQCMRLVYEPLWEFDEEYENMRFVLATSVDDSDPLHWIVKLRDDVTFANGNKFTADDVVYSLWLANNREGEPPYFLYMDNTETGTKAIDDYTVEIVFTQFNVSYANSFATILMDDKESYDPEKVAYETNGSGPYEVTNYTIQSSLDLTLRDDYWGQKPPIKNVSFKVLMEDAQRVNALETGEVDVSNVPFQDVEYVKGMEELSVRERPARSCRAIFVNVTNPDCIFYDNMDARLAVYHAINPESVLKIVYNNYGAVAKAPYTMNAVDANPDDFGKGIYDGSAYNPELAKQLAESSGLTKVNLVCINNGSSDMVTTSELLQQALKEIGVTMEVKTTDAGSWLTYRFDDTSFDLCVDFTGALTATSDVPLWWQYAGNCGTAPEKTPAAAAHLRELTDAIAMEPDAAMRKQMVSDITNELINLNYFYNLVDMATFQAYNKNLELPRISNSWIDWSNAYWTA